MSLNKETAKIVNPVINWGMYIVIKENEDFEPLHMTLLCQEIETPVPENPTYRVSFQIYRIHEEDRAQQAKRIDIEGINNFEFPIKDLDSTAEEYENYLEKLFHDTVCHVTLEPHDTFKNLEKWASEPYKPDIYVYDK